MSIRSWTVLTLLIAVSPLSAQNDEAALRRADSLWASSYASHDTTVALAVIHPEFFMTSTDGSHKDRTRELGDVRESPGYTVDYFRSADVRARVMGDGAYTTGRLEWQLNGGAETRRRYTAVWQRGGAHGWQLVALHVGRSP